MTTKHHKPTKDTNAGAHAERRAVLAYTRRQIKALSTLRRSDGTFDAHASGRIETYKAVRDWLLARKVTTGKLPGGVGRR